MLFPNHPAFQEIRPGMGFHDGAFPLGYAPGARNFGYAPGARNFGDVAHMGYAPGARGMGDLSASMKNLAVDDGIAPNDIDLLDSLGATDQDLTDLINGNITLTALYAKYGVTIPSTSTATAAAQPSSTIPTATSGSSSPAQSPPGSTLLYTATYNPVAGWTTASSAIAALSPLLPSHGMSVQSSQVSASGLISTAAFSVSVLDSVGHALISDAKSVLDALMNQITNNGLKTSTLTMVAPGTTASGQPAPSLTSDPVSWLEDNALYIGLGIGALVLLNNFTGGRKRR